VKDSYRLRVLIINNEFPPIGGGSGLGSYYLARELAGRGVKVTVLAPQGDFEALPTLPPEVRFIPVPSWRKGIHEAGKRGIFWFLIFGGIRFLALRLKQFDVLIYYSSIPAGLLSFLKRHRREVMTLHGLDVPGRDSASFAMLHRLLTPFNVRTWRQSAAVTTNSENLRQSALRLTPDLPIEVIPQGVDRTMFYPTPFREKPQPLIIIGAGRLIPLKGFQYLVEAMRDLPPERFQLRLIGKGAYEADLRVMVERLNLHDRVKFLGYHTQGQTADLLREADIFALPSYGDSFANTFLEAMACGVPVIGAAVGGALELITHGENGLLVPPHDAQALTTALKMLESDPDLRLRLREAGLATIERNYSWETYGWRYWELCQRIIQQRR